MLKGGDMLDIIIATEIFDLNIMLYDYALDKSFELYSNDDNKVSILKFTNSHYTNLLLNNRPIENSIVRESHYIGCLNINGLRGKTECKIEKNRVIYKTHELSVNIMDDDELSGLFLIETKLKGFDRNVQLPG